MIRTLQELTASLNPETDPEHFQLIGSLANLGQDQSTRLIGFQRDMILGEVEKIGIPFEADDIPDAAIEVLRACFKMI